MKRGALQPIRQFRNPMSICSVQRHSGIAEAVCAGSSREKLHRPSHHARRMSSAIERASSNNQSGVKRLPSAGKNIARPRLVILGRGRNSRLARRARRVKRF